MREKEFQDRVIELAKWEKWLAYHVPDSRRVTSPSKEVARRARTG